MQNLLIIAFYFTPIIWKTEQVPAAMLHYINYNPLDYYFNIIRPPLLGVMPDAHSISVALIITVILFTSNAIAEQNAASNRLLIIDDASHY